MTGRRVVLLHGFAGSPASWDGVVDRLPDDWVTIRPALAGHRPSDPWPEEVTCFDDEVDRLAALVPADVPSLLCGYSLGGRLALGLLGRCPERFEAALVVGAHPGLPESSVPGGSVSGGSESGGSVSRTERRASDERWAQRIEQDLSAFVEAWAALPLFDSQRRLPAARLESQRRTRLSHRPDTLARAMRVLSLGAMPDHRPRLRRLRIPLVLMAGALDEKFADLAGELASLLPFARAVTVPEAGHNVPLEAPCAVADALRELSEAAVSDAPAGAGPPES